MDDLGELTLPFRGARDYVQGAELCDAMLARLGDAVSGLSFSAHEMIRVHRLEMLALGPDETARLADFPVRLTLMQDGARRAFVLRPIPGSDGPEGVDDHEAAIRAAAALDGGAIALDAPGAVSPLSALATAVSLKKKLMQTLFPERTGKWIFCRLDAAAPPPADAPKRIAVRFRQSVRNIFLSEVRFDDAPAARMQFMVT